MHFVYIRVKSSGYDIPWALIESGHHVTGYDSAEFDPLSPIPEQLDSLRSFLSDISFDYLISYLFIPEISEICQKNGYKYICWVYDSPLISLYHPAVHNPCNYIFIFDRSEYEHMKSLNIPHLYYLPLGVNISRMGVLDITPSDEKQFSCDVSFVGSLYEDNSYNSFISQIPEDLAIELKLYLLKNLCQWENVKPWPKVSQQMVNYMKEHFGADIWNRNQIDLDLYLGILLLSRKLAEMDRTTVLNELAAIYPVELYTRSNCSNLQNVHIHGGVDYYTDMSKIFFLSRINLNITLPSIETGLPQRIFDIMGSGGFVLTNYQKEIDEYFTIGKEIEVFHNLKELKEKTAYYLSHEKERLQIAINGYQKVRRNFSYQHQMMKILNIITED